MLTKIPQGQSFTAPDGSVYTGLKEVDSKKGLFTVTETDRNGRVTQVTTRFNPQTQKMEIVGSLDLGIIGKGFKSIGGGGGGGSDERTTTPTVSFEEWLRQKQEREQFTYEIGRPDILARLQEEYRREIGGASQLNLKELKKSITAKDRKEMIRQGLNPNSREDILGYIGKEELY